VILTLNSYPVQGKNRRVRILESQGKNSYPRVRISGYKFLP
jgi:hypothetical protein